MKKKDAKLVQLFVRSMSAAALSLIILLGTSAGVDADEAGEKKMQEWITDPLAEDLVIDGMVGMLYWWGMKNFTYEKHAVARFFLRDYDPGTDTYTEIAEITHIQQNWARTYDFSSTVGDATISGRVRLFSDRVEILSWEVT